MSTGNNDRELQIVLTLDGKQFNAAIRTSATSAEYLIAKSQKLAVSNVKLNESFRKTSTGGNEASYALMNLNRVVSDAPFGFIAISNNIEPAIYSLQSLIKSSGGVKAGLLTLASSFAGPMGIMTAVSLATSALTFFSLQSRTTKTDTKELKDEVENLKNEYEKLTRSGLQNELTKEKQNLLDFTSALQKVYGDRIAFLNAAPMGIGKIFNKLWDEGTLSKEDEKQYNAIKNKINALQELAVNMGYIMELEKDLASIEEKKRHLPKGLEHIYDTEISRLKNLMEATEIVKKKNESGNKQKKDSLILTDDQISKEITLLKLASEKTDSIREQYLYYKKIKALQNELDSVAIKANEVKPKETKTENTIGENGVPKTLSLRTQAKKNPGMAYVENSLSEIAEVSKLATQATDTLITTMVNGFLEARLSLKGVVTELGTTIAKMVLLGTLRYAVDSFVLGPLGLLVGQHHTGGIAGKPSKLVLADQRSFVGAPKFHSGGVVGIPSILQAGEMVLTEAMQKNMLRILSSNQLPNLSGYNNNNQTITVEVKGRTRMSGREFVTQFEKSQSSVHRMIGAFSAQGRK
ncbi:MAG: hypothetical protein IPH62_16430 [Ignavibacteriae bacterium]|nr:hypothetical protein [Ignavibacteriota bacterium]